MGANYMSEFLQKSPLFPTAFSADLARTTVAALRESALAEWRSNAERFYDYDAVSYTHLTLPTNREV